VHVWGGISWYGATSVCIFTGIMESNGKKNFERKSVTVHQEKCTQMVIGCGRIMI
jgi:hypothetical protein